ncbi:hypothetical protein VNO78_21512 [Psophocarpus tetragonolobus]|uniref:Uncharacterized protein n=1 Tax=Psophocarpus tetragonolobus TaxID=3891 RepID=A0AAN9SC90_PSOTE
MALHSVIIWEICNPLGDLGFERMRQSVVTFDSGPFGNNVDPCYSRAALMVHGPEPDFMEQYMVIVKALEVNDITTHSDVAVGAQ